VAEDDAPSATGVPSSEGEEDITAAAVAAGKRRLLPAFAPV
jgi:hypothetical protein